MKQLILSACALSLLFATSCKKDNDSNPSNGGGNSSRKTTLTSGKWKMIASTTTYSVAGQTFNVDLYAMLQSCTTDNLFFFNSDGTATQDEGATKCNASAPQTSAAGNWSLGDNDTKLIGSFSGTNITADILELSNTSMKLRYVTNYTGIPATTTTTYTHIN